MPFLELRCPFPGLFERAEKACDEARWSREKMQKTADHGRVLIVDIEERKKIAANERIRLRNRALVMEEHKP